MLLLCCFHKEIIKDHFTFTTAPHNELTAVSKKNSRLTATACSPETPSNVAPLMNTSSRAPIPPMVKGMTAAMELARKSSRKGMRGPPRCNACMMQITLSNCAPCTNTAISVALCITGKYIRRKK